MWSISSSQADNIFVASNWILIAGAFAVFVGTIGSITMGAAREYFANERLAANEVAVQRAKAESEIAKEGAAKATARALEAQLALAKFKAARELSPDQRTALIEAMKPFAGHRFSGMVAAAVSDARPLWNALAASLKRAGWIFELPAGLARGEPPAGVPISPNEGVTIFVPAQEISELAPAANALYAALNAAGIKTFEAKDGGPQAKAGVLAIEVGTKPQT